MRKLHWPSENTPRMELVLSWPSRDIGTWSLSFISFHTESQFERKEKKRWMSKNRSQERTVDIQRTDGRTDGRYRWWQTRGGTEEDEVGGNLTPSRSVGNVRAPLPASTPSFYHLLRQPARPPVGLSSANPPERRVSSSQRQIFFPPSASRLISRRRRCACSLMWTTRQRRTQLCSRRDARTRLRCTFRELPPSLLLVS